MDWAKGYTEILNWLGLLVWVERQVEVEESCGIFVGFILEHQKRRFQRTECWIAQDHIQ
jgi:hypothetical protein